MRFIVLDFDFLNTVPCETAAIFVLNDWMAARLTAGNMLRGRCTRKSIRLHPLKHRLFMRMYEPDTCMEISDNF